MKRYIITGAPGTGKTTLINTLKQKGFLCFDEVSRRVIKQQQDHNGSKTPWGDIVGFSELVYCITIKELETPTNNSKVFVDRGLVDVMAYLKHKKQAISKVLEDFDYHKVYSKTVFMLPLWEAIYLQDAQRLQDIEEARKIEELLYVTYKQLGFHIIMLNKDTPVNRVKQILNSID